MGAHRRPCGLSDNSAALDGSDRQRTTLFPGKASPRGGTGGVPEHWQRPACPGAVGKGGGVALRAARWGCGEGR